MIIQESIEQSVMSKKFVIKKLIKDIEKDVLFILNFIK